MTKPNGTNGYRYRPVLFFVLTYLFTWIFWIPAAFVPGNTGALLMAAGLIAPAAVSTAFVLLSGSDALKKDLKVKLVGMYKVKWANVLLAIGVFAVIVAASILLSLAFGQKMSQFALAEDFSFTGVGIGSALATILLASIIEEVGWKGYCEDSIGNYMNWFWESLVFGVIWSLWHFPLLIFGDYMEGTPLWYQLVAFVLCVFPIGIIAGILTIQSKSVWPAAFLHAGHNAYDQAVFGVITKGDDRMFFVSETGVFTIACAWIIAAIMFVIYVKTKKKK